MSTSHAGAQTAPIATPRDSLWGVVGDAPDTQWRVLSLLNAYRILVTLSLLALFYLIETPRVVGQHHPIIFLFAAFGYLLLAVGSVYTLSRRAPSRRLQMSVMIAADIVAVTTMMHASGGIGSGLGNLLVVAIGGASLTMMTRSAGLFAALATLAVLFEQALSQLEGTTTAADYTATGLLGAILFAIAVAAQPLARRIRESEALAQQRGVDLANLAELNDYIIQHLRESIVVVDAEDRIRLMNESAAKILGAGGDVRGRALAQVSPDLHALLQQWRAQPEGRRAEPPPLVGPDRSTLITPHVAPLGKTRPAALLVFLEDASLLAERVQQSKLAALGRLSASIAHEIRNPVGAMSHAGQLLAECAALGEHERRLTDIIHQNAGRVSTIVDNVLQLSRRDTTEPERLTLENWLNDFVAEFGATNELDAGQIEVHCAQSGLEVRMDPSHLQQVLWNLCDNVVKYAGRAGARHTLQLYLGRLPVNDRPYLEVTDRGPGIAPDLVERIFEPFVTSASGGTGLGLFIARQLCECNGAALLYEPRAGGGSVFRIVFADPSRWAVDT